MYPICLYVSINDKAYLSVYIHDVIFKPNKNKLCYVCVSIKKYSTYIHICIHDYVTNINVFTYVCWFVFNIAYIII